MSQSKDKGKRKFDSLSELNEYLSTILVDFEIVINDTHRILENEHKAKYVTSEDINKITKSSIDYASLVLHKIGPFWQTINKLSDYSPVCTDCSNSKFNLPCIYNMARKHNLSKWWERIVIILAIMNIGLGLFGIIKWAIK